MTTVTTQTTCTVRASATTAHQNIRRAQKMEIGDTARIIHADGSEFIVWRDVYGKVILARAWDESVMCTVGAKTGVTPWAAANAYPLFAGRWQA